LFKAVVRNGAEGYSRRNTGLEPLRRAGIHGATPPRTMARLSQVNRHAVS